MVTCANLFTLRLAPSPVAIALVFLGSLAMLCFGSTAGAGPEAPRRPALAPASVAGDAGARDAELAGGSVPDAAAMIMALETQPKSPHPTLLRHTLEGERDCLRCHAEGKESPFPANHKERSEATCLHCHIVSDAVEGQAGKQAPESGVELANNGFCLGCHTDRSLEMTLPAGETMSLYVDPEAYGRSVHGRVRAPCMACHPEMGRYPHPNLGLNSRRELSRNIAQKGCGSCHETVFRDYRESVHGKALVEEGNLDVPGCPDCHGIHNVQKPKTVAFRMGSTDTCSKCHSDSALAKKYGMSDKVTVTYLRDFHGASVRLTRARGSDLPSDKPVCYDCHGIHDIKKVNDPDSRVVKERLVATCQKCHPGANASFPSAWLKHYDPDSKKFPLVYWVNFAYKLLIPGIIGPMIVYILLDLMRAAINYWKGHSG